MTNNIVLATSNQGKIKEIQSILASLNCIPQKDLSITDAEETGTTFIENALLKARHASRESNMPALADDSGLVIPALNGRPGIYSSRFAGAKATDNDNINQVLTELDAQSLKSAPAFFYCVVVMVEHADTPTPIFGVGQFDGEVITTPSGAHGFGYDPIFYLPAYQCTLAELSATEKNKLSHRAQALKALVENKRFSHYV